MSWTHNYILCLKLTPCKLYLRASFFFYYGLERLRLNGRLCSHAHCGLRKYTPFNKHGMCLFRTKLWTALVHAGTLQKIRNGIGKCGKCVCAWSSLVLRGIWIQCTCGVWQTLQLYLFGWHFFNAATFYVPCLFDMPMASMTGDLIVSIADRLQAGCSTDRN